MAAADLRAELSCSICLSIYTDPVSLPCGHNFCRGCIGTTWDTQERSGAYSCPECRAEYRERPALYRNTTLGNIAVRFCLTETEYYGCGESVCICVSCCLAGEHRGHRVELLSEASEKKKVLENLRSIREETEREVQRLQERRREVAENAAGETERVTALFRDIREQREALEKRLLSDISRQQENLTDSITDRIMKLEIKNDKLSKKICYLEELCNMADPKRRVIPGKEATDLLLDINTAHNHVFVSGDRKCATYSLTDQRHTQSPEEFHEYPQVLSTKSVPSGRYYWEVEASELGGWRVGVSYPNIERRGGQACIGYNNKSWCLCRWAENKYSVTHDSRDTPLPHVPSSRRIRISLDYGAGRLSFYELSEPIRHLHTFNAKFTEPLHIGFGIGRDSTWVRIIS